MNLKDIPDAVKDYLNSKVTVTITPFDPAGGTEVNPNETFSFAVKAANAAAADGGVTLKNVKYKVWVVNPGIAQVKGPEGSIPAGFTGEFICDPPGSNYDLPAGDNDTLPVQGKATGAQGGGTTQIRARVLADIDMDQLFPKGEDSGTAQRTLTVSG